MRSRLVFLSILVSVLLMPLGQCSVVAAQQLNLGDAAALAEQLSVLESESNWDALYDRLHPDSQLTVDRATVAYWYDTYFAVNGPYPATVDAVTLTEWTWPVTGRTYPRAAEVAYTQAFDNGVTVNDVVRLVQATDGSWRWFFGRSPEFVQQIAQEAGRSTQDGSIPERTAIASDQLFAEAIAGIAGVAPSCFVAAGIQALPDSIGLDSRNSRGSESGARAESAFFMSPSVLGGFPDLVANSLALGNGSTVESVTRQIDASRLQWDGPPGSAPPRGFVANLAPGSGYLISYYEEYSEATAYMPVLMWGAPDGHHLFSVVGPAAGLINELVAKWSANALATCAV